MDQRVRYEFVGGPLDALAYRVPHSPDGRPLATVYVQYDDPRSAVLPPPGHPQAGPDKFTGPYVTYVFTLNRARPLDSTYVLIRHSGDEPWAEHIGRIKADRKAASKRRRAERLAESPLSNPDRPSWTE